MVELLVAWLAFDAVALKEMNLEEKQVAVLD